MRSDLLALAERCEQVSGDTLSAEMRTLNADILRCLGWRVAERDLIDPAGNVRLQAPDLVGSLDAAALLVPEGDRLRWSLGVIADEQSPKAQIWQMGGYGNEGLLFGVSSSAATPALALTAAALKAHALLGKEPQE